MVDMVRVSSSLCAGMMWYMTFTSKRLLQGDDAAVTFEASVYMGIDETEVSSVHMLDEESGQENPERKMKTEMIEEPVEEPVRNEDVLYLNGILNINELHKRERHRLNNSLV